MGILERGGKVRTVVVPSTKRKTLQAEVKKQGWFGGNAGPIWPRDRNFFSALDMTAISLIFTDSGFVIAADGFSRWNNETNITEALRENERDDEQKIFKVRCEGTDVAYAVSGAVYNADKSFDLVAETTKALKALPRRRCSGVGKLSELLAYRLRRYITKARDDSRLDSFDPIEKGVATIFLAGYFGRPRRCSLAILQFFHENQSLVEPSIKIQTPPEANIFFGSEEIAKRVFWHLDERFEKYFRDVNRSSSIEEAAECAQGYIEACSDPLALEVDPRYCKGIGGHTHIAVVTPEGFEWLIPPKT